MDTSLEALFKDMMAHGWFVQTEGDVESPCGYFGYTNQTKAELNEIYQAFEHTVEAYGKPKDEDIVGSFFAYINDQGIIRITRYDTLDEAKKEFDLAEEEYVNWDSEEDV